MKIIKMLLLFVFCVCSIYSQVQQEWVRSFQIESTYVECRDIKMDILGNVIVTGFISEGNNADFLTIKYNPSGQLVFSKTFDNNSSEGGRALAIDNSGNIYVTGDALGGTSFLLLKYDPNGNVVWSRSNTSGPLFNFAAIDVKLDVNNNVFITGNTWINNGKDIATAKYNNDGILQWIMRFNSVNDSIDHVKNIEIDDSGNIYVCGHSFNPAANYDLLIVKYDNSGNLLWSKFYDDSNAENILYDSYMDNSGNLLLTGISLGNFFTVKIDDSGNEVWRALYSGIEPGNQPNAIITDDNNNVYVTGQSKDSTIVNFNIATLKYNSSGILQWERRFSGPGLEWDAPNDIALDDNSNVYVTGFITNGLNNRDFMTLRYSASGFFEWSNSYNAGGYDVSIGVVCDESGNVFVAGNSEPSSNSKISIVKYSQTIGINPISTEIPGKFLLSQNFPNPFNPATKIGFALPMSSFAQLVVYDMLGREVAALVNEQLSPGIYEVSWDAGLYPSGVYFYKLQAGDFSETKKMMLIK